MNYTLSKLAAGFSLASMVLVILGAPARGAFSDVTSSTLYKDAILYAQEQKFVSGYADGGFRPTSRINRAEFNKIIVGGVFSYAPTQETSLYSLQGLPFHDLQNGAWYNPYFRKSYEQKIMTGYGDGSMRPANTISFVEAAAIIVRAFQFPVSADSIWYRPYVNKLAELKAIPTTISSYDHHITRAEMVEILYRLKLNLQDRPTLDGNLKPVNFPITTPTPTGPIPPVSPDIVPPKIGSCQIFPSDNPWNRDISKDPLDPNSANYIKYITSLGGNQTLKIDTGGNGLYGIPYVIVDSAHPRLNVNIWEYPEESDHGPYPIPANAPVESGSDGHILAVDKDECMLYELYKAEYNGSGWDASIAAKFDLKTNALRPDGWTSADAAGLPIFPGLIRYDEADAGAINHALRVTFSKTQRAYINPATHYASSITDPNAPPMGLRLRLKANYDISKFQGRPRAILEAMKKYGLIVADNGSNWYVTGAMDKRWSDSELHLLRTVPGSAFEVVQSGKIMK